MMIFVVFIIMLSDNDSFHNYLHIPSNSQRCVVTVTSVNPLLTESAPIRCSCRIYFSTPNATWFPCWCSCYATWFSGWRSSYAICCADVPVTQLVAVLLYLLVVLTLIPAPCPACCQRRFLIFTLHACILSPPPYVIPSLLFPPYTACVYSLPTALRHSVIIFATVYILFIGHMIFI